MSTEPSSPKPDAASPVRAFTAIKCRPAVKSTRAGALLSPGQKATPRADVLPVGSLCSQTTLPVSASSARTRPPAGKYITPLMTIGVASGFTVGAPPAPRPPRRPPAAGALLSRYVQAGFRLDAFVALICVSGE